MLFWITSGNGPHLLFVTVFFCPWCTPQAKSTPPSQIARDLGCYLLLLFFGPQLLFLMCSERWCREKRAAYCLLARAANRVRRQLIVTARKDMSTLRGRSNFASETSSSRCSKPWERLTNRKLDYYLSQQVDITDESCAHSNHVRYQMSKCSRHSNALRNRLQLIASDCVMHG